MARIVDAPHHYHTAYAKCPETLSLEPLKRDIQTTSLKTLVQDAEAGLSVALLSIPQAIAYSVVAGVPPIAGLLSTIFGTMIASLFSSSRHLIIGPNNATVILVQAAASEIFLTNYAFKMSSGVRELATLELTIVLTMLIGLIQIVASIFKLGRVLQFVSHSVIVGYIAGSAFAILVEQLFIATGTLCPDNLETTFQKLIYWGTHLQDIHLMTVSITILSVALLLVFKKKSPVRLLPASLITLIVVGTAVAGIGIEKTEDKFGKKVTLATAVSPSEIWGGAREPQEELPQEEPSQTPAREQEEGSTHASLLTTVDLDFTLLNDLIPIAFAIALIGVLETNSVAKTIAVKSGQTVTSSQDMFALGCSNFFISFLSALPCSGSMSRTSTNYDSGAKTRLSGILSGLFVALIVLVFGPCIGFLPQASLAAILFCAVPKMIDMKQISLCLRATKSDALVIFVTFLSCIFLSLQIAFYIGVMLSIALYLRKAAIPRVVECQYDETLSQVRPMPEEERKNPRTIRIINVEGELFFGAVDLFQYALKAISEDDRATRVIILRLKHVRDLDATAALALRQLKEYLDGKGIQLIISSVPSHVLRFLEDSRLADFVGRENIITFDAQSLQSTTQRALQRAEELVRRPEELQGDSFELFSEDTLSPGSPGTSLPGTGSYLRVENPTWTRG